MNDCKGAENGEIPVFCALFLIPLQRPEKQIHKKYNYCILVFYNAHIP